ncbi:hypothetical protein ANN_08582 [Periplaneta americana]|uniref:Reverse transcriptase domain-containing protein n=1 Tax=Periplaneta americana TaxID=6978 RepID=A0ABQ8T1V8_PERAM|nr:hypothetical protein ANN_08582 [Periplaneta americana]
MVQKVKIFYRTKSLEDVKDHIFLLLFQCDIKPFDALASDERMDKFCEYLGVASWFPTSAKTDINITEAVLCLIEKIRENLLDPRNVPRKDPQIVSLSSRPKTDDKGKCYYTWKLVYITAISKQKKNPKVSANRRPISLINDLGKVFERILLTRLLQSVPNLIPPYQAAYQQGLSTTHQLLRLVEQTTIGFNNRATTVAIFLDVKNLPETDVTRLALYADDTLAYTTHRNADLAIGRLQRYVHLIEEWFQHWCLLVNTMKSQVIAFSRTRSVPQTKLTLYGTALEFQDSVKYLGIHLDSRLLWHTNAAQIHEQKQ